jgi:hypothetical protein
VCAGDFFKSKYQVGSTRYVLEVKFFNKKDKGKEISLFKSERKRSVWEI